MVCLAAGVALAGEAIVINPGAGGAWQYFEPQRLGKTPGSGELTIEQLRKLGLSAEQIQKVADARRDIEKQRVALETRLAAANAEVSRLQQEMRDLATTKLTKAMEAVMTPDQVKAWQQQEALDQAKQWLQSYRYWLKLTDAQVDDLATLLAPVFVKYTKMEQDATDARTKLSELRRADKVDVAAVDVAEKKVAELTTQNVWQKRQTELMEKMRPGLMPDQIEKLDKMRGGQGGARF
jgi:DNA-binding transcriptional MerR regulator